MSSIVVAGDTSGTITIAAPAVAGSGTLTLPLGTDTLAGIAATQTLTNKTLTTPTFDSASLATISGTAPLYMCRAWVNFNGTGTVAIRASGNVSSITDNGVGNYTVNMTNAMPDVNYAVVCSGQTTASFPNPLAWPDPRTGAFTTSSCSITTTNGSFTNADSSAVSVSIFR